jgi:hypothetical protein
MRRFFTLTFRPLVWISSIAITALIYLLRLFVDDLVLAKLKAYGTSHGYPDKLAQVLSWVIQHPVRSAVVSTCAVVSCSAIASWREIRRLHQHDSHQSLTPHVQPEKRGFELTSANKPLMAFLDLEKREIQELGNSTGCLLPVRNNATSFRGDAHDVVAHLTYQPLVPELSPPLEIHRGLWIGRDSWYRMHISAGETLHLAIAVCNVNGCVAPSLPPVQQPESVRAESLRMLGYVPPQTIGTFQLADGEWRIVVIVRGEGFSSRCTVLITVQNQVVTRYRVVTEQMTG